MAPADRWVSRGLRAMVWSELVADDSDDAWRGPLRDLCTLDATAVAQDPEVGDELADLYDDLAEHGRRLGRWGQTVVCEVMAEWLRGPRLFDEPGGEG